MVRPTIEGQGRTGQNGRSVGDEMDTNATPTAEQGLLSEVGELIFRTLVSGVLATLSLGHAVGWMTSSEAQAIYFITAFWVPLTVARYLRLRSRLLGNSKSEWIANVTDGLVGVVLLGAIVVFLAALYGAATADVLGIRSTVIWVGSGVAAVVLAFAAAGLAKRRGWRLVAEHDEPGATFNTFFLILSFPMMLGLFAFAAEIVTMMVMERLGVDTEPLRRILNDNGVIVGIGIFSVAILMVAGLLHAVSKRRLPGREANYVCSVMVVGFGILTVEIILMALIAFTGGVPQR